MKIFHKKTAIIFILVLMIVSLVGCSGDELSLYKAMLKMQDITYYEQISDVSLRFDYQGEKNTDLDKVKLLMNSFKFTSKQNYSTNKSKDIMKISMDALMTLDDMTYNYKVWLDTNMTEKAPYYRQIIKMPFIARVSASEEYTNKEYIVIDSNNISSDNEEAMVFQNLPKLNKDIIQKSNDFIEKYMTDFIPNVKMVTKGESALVDGERATVYEVKLDDASLKSLVKHFVNDFANDEEAVDMMKDLAFVFYDVYGINQTNTYEEFKAQLDDVENQIPEMIEQFNTAMEKLENINILGKNGISIKYYINNKGYIIKQEGSVDLLLNVRKLAEAFEMNEDDLAGVPSDNVFEIGVDFTNTFKNINKAQEVVLPNINEDNSIDFFKLIEELQNPISYDSFEYFQDYNQEEESEEPGIKIRCEGYKVNLNNEIIVLDDVIYIPAQDFMEDMYVEWYWDNTANTLFGFINGYFIILKDNDYTMYMNGQTFLLSNKTFMKDGVLYIPLRSFAEKIGYAVEWEEETQTVHLKYIFPTFEF